MFNLDADDALFQRVTAEAGVDRGLVELRRFPDGESFVRFDTDCDQRDVIILCSLDRPDAKVLPLLLAAATLHDLGASRVGLIAPYLAYMRQDKRFHRGEGVTARYFARLISDHFDWLITVDPHLHRFHALEEIYTIPTQVVHAAPLLADWICNNVPDPVLIGPDGESEQWVADIAARVKAPYLILEKVRYGDRSVQVSIPQLDQYLTCTPVLVDDIISTGHTLVATIEHLTRMEMRPPVCVAVHGVFADGAVELLRKAGALAAVTCNTVTHTSNDIDVSELIAAAVLGSVERRADSTTTTSPA